MSIPDGIRTPGFYGEYDLNAPRPGLPANRQRVLFVAPSTTIVANPVDVTSKYDADQKFGDSSIIGKMTEAAIKTFRFVDVQAMSLTSGVARLMSTEGGDTLSTEDGSPVGTEG